MIRQSDGASLVSAGRMCIPPASYTSEKPATDQAGEPSLPLWTRARDRSMLTPMQAAPLSNIAEFTVSELSSAIKRTVEDAFGLVRLRGEVSGYRGPHSSGHAYLCLKDDSARLDAVIWRSAFAKLKF